MNAKTGSVQENTTDLEFFLFFLYSDSRQKAGEIMIKKNVNV